jgi:hypothetical protein
MEIDAVHRRVVEQEQDSPRNVMRRGKSLCRCAPDQPALSFAFKYSQTPVAKATRQNKCCDLVKTTCFGSPSLRGALATKHSRGRSLRPLDRFAAFAMTAEAIRLVWRVA